jgi:hypothetical protein
VYVEHPHAQPSGFDASLRNRVGNIVKLKVKEYPFSFIDKFANEPRPLGANN